jgi:P-type conjugative transfer protein TrbG
VFIRMCFLSVMGVAAWAQLPPALATKTKAESKPAEVKQPPPAPALPPSANEAVFASATWRADANAPSVGPNGRVTYSFGAGLPVVVCAPLRICLIELEPGEKILGEPQVGDSVRWNISPAVYGAGPEAVSAIVLKPLAVGLDTNLAILTDRRAYYIRLISHPEDYTARVAFTYAEDHNKGKWQEHIEAQNVAAKLEKREAELLPAMITAEKMNFDYRVTGGNEHVRPVRVYDDGAKTYLQMPTEMRNREAPVLLVVGKDGNGEMTNYRVKEQTYIVDRLFDRARLVLGAGKKAKGQTVEISRGTKG